jgi:hypothetical protein
MKASIRRAASLGSGSVFVLLAGMWVYSFWGYVLIGFAPSSTGVPYRELVVWAEGGEITISGIHVLRERRDFKYCEVKIEAQHANFYFDKWFGQLTFEAYAEPRAGGYAVGLEAPGWFWMALTGVIPAACAVCKPGAAWEAASTAATTSAPLPIAARSAGPRRERMALRHNPHLLHRSGTCTQSNSMPF